MKIYHAHIAFVDMLFNLLLGFFYLFVLAFIQINQDQHETKQVESKAEFIVTVFWENERDDDVDTYVEDPQGRLVCFRRREDGLMHLDRDDLGTDGDVIHTPSGETIVFKENREIVTIRGIIAGEYVVNVHMYEKNSKDDTKVTIRLEKVNPLISTIVIKERVLVKKTDEKTAFRFVLDKEGNVIEVNELEKKLTNATPYEGR